MKAVVFHGIGDIRLDNVPEPRIEKPDDAIVKLTSSAICGTDLHMVRGTLSDMEPGTILGHEGVGIIEEMGPGVRNLRKGERVVIPSTIACGHCSYCRAGYYAQCDHANPHGPLAGTAFFGGPRSSGPFQGLQAEYARIPYAQVGPVILPDGISDNQAILLSDIFPTRLLRRQARLREGRGYRDHLRLRAWRPVCDRTLQALERRSHRRIAGPSRHPRSGRRAICPHGPGVCAAHGARPCAGGRRPWTLGTVQGHLVSPDRHQPSGSASGTTRVDPPARAWRLHKSRAVRTSGGFQAPTTMKRARSEQALAIGRGV